MHPKIHQNQSAKNPDGILMGVTSKDLDMLSRFDSPQYARILGFNSKGKQLLSQIKKKSSIPLVLKLSDFIKSCDPVLKESLNWRYLPPTFM